MNAEEIERALTEMAMRIMESNRGIKKLALIGIHTGGVFLADRLQKIIKAREGVELPVGYLDITLYRDDWSLVCQNPIVKKTAMPFFVEEYTVILVDDVLYTGRTIRAALDAIMDLGRPRVIQLAVLINRQCGRELPIQPNYWGLDVQENVTDHVNVILRERGEKDVVVLEFD
jgi:pyrimidine operon attenuation protein/uracil phosphoribosyltransferase